MADVIELMTEFYIVWRVGELLNDDESVSCTSPKLLDAYELTVDRAGRRRVLCTGKRTEILEWLELRARVEELARSR